MTIVLILAVLLLALMGAPLFAVIFAAAMLGFFSQDIDLAVLAIEMYRLADTPLLISLPLFAYAGYVLAESKTSERLVAVTQAFVGWMPSGLAVVAFIACAFFTALTGASGVTIVALGALLLPALVQSNYDERFALGLVTSSGSLGLLLAPSVPLILYGVIAQQLEVGEAFEIKELFLAGLLPAAVMIGALIIYALWHNRGGSVSTTPFDAKALGRAMWAAKWELPLPFVVLGGIYSGYFAISDAAAVTALYVTFVEVFVYREISLRRLPGVMRESMVMVGSILLILAASLAFTNFLISAELCDASGDVCRNVPEYLFEWLNDTVQSKWTFLFLLVVALLILGAILDVFAAIVIMVPLILPVAVGYGIHPVHLGIVFLATMQIGYFTPPVGMNLFIASYRFNKPVTELYAACWPFMLVLLAAVLIITYVPALSMWWQP